jgi:hypothetical protein
MSNEEDKKEIIIPDEFKKIIKDLVNDVKVTFPEFNILINRWWKEKDMFKSNEEYEQAFDKSIKFIYNFCSKKYPPRFLDILYKNEDMFKEDSELDTEFLPFIHFKNLWSFDISDNTRETIWKYLQLILFSIIGSVNDKNVFGDSAKIFESINEDEFKSKLEETMTQMQQLFENEQSNSSSENSGSENINMNNLPNASEIHDHISGMMNGKLGKLAQEIAE